MGMILVMRVVVITQIVFSSLLYKVRILYYGRLTTARTMGDNLGDIAVILETRDSER